MSLQDIVRIQNAKISAFLNGECATQFWFAHYPSECPENERIECLHELGFDNYPTAQIYNVDRLYPYMFFYERMLGAEVDSPAGHEYDFFHSWCVPIINEPVDIFNISADLDDFPLWQAYENAIKGYMQETPPDDLLPIMFHGFSPLDAACSLCGTENMFMMLYDAPDAAEYLLNTIVTLMVEGYQRTKSIGINIVSYYGFPGVYCNDLQLAYLSPPHVKHFMLPCYTRFAQECDGLLIAFMNNDIDSLQSMLDTDGVIGCAFDKRIPLSEIKRRLGQKLFLMPNACYDDDLDKPTLRDGIYWNPIVQSYSRELTQVYDEFHEEHSLLISMERPTLAEICDVRNKLRTTGL